MRTFRVTRKVDGEEKILVIRAINSPQAIKLADGIVARRLGKN